MVSLPSPEVKYLFDAVMTSRILMMIDVQIISFSSDIGDEPGARVSVCARARTKRKSPIF